MVRKKLVFLGILAILGAVLFAGCGKQEGGSGASETGDAPSTTHINTAIY